MIGHVIANNDAGLVVVIDALSMRSFGELPKYDDVYDADDYDCYGYDAGLRYERPMLANTRHASRDADDVSTIRATQPKSAAGGVEYDSAMMMKMMMMMMSRRCRDATPRCASAPAMSVIDVYAMMIRDD